MPIETFPVSADHPHKCRPDSVQMASFQVHAPHRCCAVDRKSATMYLTGHLATALFYQTPS